jgi:hypothetical protein
MFNGHTVSEVSVVTLICCRGKAYACVSGVNVGNREEERVGPAVAALTKLPGWHLHRNRLCWQVDRHSARDRPSARR